MTVTEAAACGTPAVATRIAGHADAVAEGTSGLLADGHDELVAALDRVLGDPALRGPAVRGRPPPRRAVHLGGHGARHARGARGRVDPPQPALLTGARRVGVGSAHGRSQVLLPRCRDPRVPRRARHAARRDPAGPDPADRRARRHQHDADRARAGCVHDDAHPAARRALRGRGRHVHRLQRAVHRPRARARWAAALLRRERGVDRARPGGVGRGGRRRPDRAAHRARDRHAAGAARRNAPSTSRSSTPTSRCTAPTPTRSSTGCDRVASCSSTTCSGAARWSTPPRPTRTRSRSGRSTTGSRPTSGSRPSMLPLGDGLTLARRV